MSSEFRRDAKDETLAHGSIRGLTEIHRIVIHPPCKGSLTGAFLYFLCCLQERTVELIYDVTKLI